MGLVFSQTTTQERCTKRLFAISSPTSALPSFGQSNTSSLTCQSPFLPLDNTRTKRSEGNRETSQAEKKGPRQGRSARCTCKHTLPSKLSSHAHHQQERRSSRRNTLVRLFPPDHPSWTSTPSSRAPSHPVSIVTATATTPPRVAAGAIAAATALHRTRIRPWRSIPPQTEC